MITITIGNSYSKISGLTARQHKELSSLLSYVIGGSSAYYSGFGASHRTLLSKRGDFPTGLIERVEALLIKNKIPWVRVNNRKAPVKMPNLFKLTL